MRKFNVAGLCWTLSNWEGPFASLRTTLHIPMARSLQTAESEEGGLEVESITAEYQGRN